MPVQVRRRCSSRRGQGVMHVFQKRDKLERALQDACCLRPIDRGNPEHIRQVRSIRSPARSTAGAIEGHRSADSAQGEGQVTVFLRQLQAHLACRRIQARQGSPALPVAVNCVPMASIQWSCHIAGLFLNRPSLHCNSVGQQRAIN